MSVVIKKNVITMTRGDTLRATVTVKDGIGNPYTPIEQDSIRFAMKRGYDDENPVVLKSIPWDTCELHLEPSDTEDLPQPSDWVYDIEITLSNGDVQTIISSRLRLREEVY